MTDTRTARDRTGAASAGSAIAPTRLGRLYRGQTSLDFYGRRRFGFIFSAVLLVITRRVAVTRGLNLGIDFEGGIVWDVPASSFTIDDAEADPERQRDRPERGADPEAQLRAAAI